MEEAVPHFELCSQGFLSYHSLEVKGMTSGFGKHARVPLWALDQLVILYLCRAVQFTTKRLQFSHKAHALHTEGHPGHP